MPRLPISLSPSHHPLNTKDVRSMKVRTLEVLPEGGVLGTSKSWGCQGCIAVSNMAAMSMSGLVLLAVSPFEFEIVSIYKTKTFVNKPCLRSTSGLGHLATPSAPMKAHLYMKMWISKSSDQGATTLEMNLMTHDNSIHYNHGAVLVLQFRTFMVKRIYVKCGQESCCFKIIIKSTNTDMGGYIQYIHVEVLQGEHHHCHIWQMLAQPVQGDESWLNTYMILSELQDHSQGNQVSPELVTIGRGKKTNCELEKGHVDLLICEGEAIWCKCT
jgi:hypothetical protein